MEIGTLKLRSRVLAAPMAGVIDLPMRILSASFGAGLVFTEMISAEGMVREQKRTLRYITCHLEEMPLGVQIFGKNPSTMARAAKMAQDLGASIIDINMGCPVRKITRQGAGASLLKDPDLAGSIVKEVRRAVDVPLTVKIRAGWDESGVNFIDIGRMIEEAGADAVILHPRVATEFFAGKADWDKVGELSEALSIPVVGSGDILSYEEALGRIEETGAKFAMIGRGAMGRPWVFSPASDPGPYEILSVIQRHIGLIVDHYGGERAVPIIRKHVSYYIKGMRGAVDVRRRLMGMGDIDEITSSIGEYLKEGGEIENGAKKIGTPL
ncbi:MAG: tRNA dihydrouridine synthase DusB [Deltaproteobacteria bacterium]|uniref:tRNA-dihydrouridine synthase n=1 Tax=Candidatus Zymogenus saltonus TaxID=2844893 RepID=A0A9D8PNL7_9DELT|nr:tRNA dihydrouridine synthase DusB [Candidatus Zymogenus saltonus]